MRINLKEYLKSLNVELSSDLIESITTALNKLGYDLGDLFSNPVIDHPILRGIPIDFAVLKHKNRYGMIIRVRDKITREFEEELCGVCAVIGALYGVLTDGNEVVIIKPKSGFEWEYLDRIPSKEELEEELGIKDYTIIAITYDEYEEKIDEIDVVVDNCRYVYLDVDNSRVVIIQPNRRLVRWLRDRKVSFYALDDEDFVKTFSKF